MNVRNLLTDDDAVSPVIGVILMVAITVILAAVIATFVLGLGESVSQTAPQASFNADFEEGATGPDSFGNDPTTVSNGGIVTFVHSGGDRLEASNLYLTGSSVNESRTPWTASDDPYYGEGSTITAGNSVDYAVASDDTVRLVWDNGQGNSATLKTWNGPDAS